MIHYELVKVTIDASGLAKLIINVVVRSHSIFELIITNPGSLFILKFWSLLYYFLDVKKRILTTFHL